MERCFIINIGFHSDVGLRRISDSYVKKGEKIIIISGPENPTSLKAIEEFKHFASKLGLDNNLVTTIHMNFDRPWESIVKLTEVIKKECGDRHLILELGGGMRGASVLVLLSALASGQKFSIESAIEGSPETLRIPYGFIDFIINRFGTKDGEILEAILESPRASYKEIAAKLHIGEKTVINRISRLRKIGLVEKRGRGYPALTPWGEAAARLNMLPESSEIE
ncbi:MAG: CRISPR-associated CARF protein Csa3 [Fervidicoccaceae archaeon]